MVLFGVDLDTRICKTRFLPGLMNCPGQTIHQGGAWIHVSAAGIEHIDTYPIQPLQLEWPQTMYSYESDGQKQTTRQFCH